ncbi:MAG: HAD family phosphatase [Nitriliruptoraceae bacterium]|nr:HAD family phosphatase [Nitriliruptoraceae bacterium]
MVRAVAFDLMDTVLADPFREALEAATGLPLVELFARREPGVYPAFERGELDEDAYWAHYADAGIDADPAAFHRVRRAGTGYLPGMADLLDDLEGVVVRATASNYPVWVEELAEVHLQGRFEHVLASCHLGVRKPEARFYEAILDRLALPADEVLFVDDRAENIAGAEQVGITSHRFEDAAVLRTWLIDHGVPLGPSADAG